MFFFLNPKIETYSQNYWQLKKLYEGIWPRYSFFSTKKTLLFSKNNDWEFHACLVRKFESIFFSTASKHLAGLEAALDCCVQITQDFDKCFCYCGLFVEPTDGIKGPFIKKINVSILRSVLLSHVLRPQDFHYRFDFQIQEEKQVLILFSLFKSYKMMAHTSHCFYFWHSTISEPRLFRKYIF